MPGLITNPWFCTGLECMQSESHLLSLFHYLDKKKIDMQKHLSCFRCKKSNPSRMPATSQERSVNVLFVQVCAGMCSQLVLTCSDTARFLAVETEVGLKMWRVWSKFLQTFAYQGKRCQMLLSMLKPNASGVTMLIQMSGSDKNTTHLSHCSAS